MKHFFFLDQSDFLTNFLDLAHSELRKQSKQASLVKLQSLLDLAVRNPASSSSNDPYKDNLKVTIASQGLYDWLLKIVSRTGGGLGDDGNGGGGGGGGDLDFGSSDKLDDEAAVQKTLFGESLLWAIGQSWPRRACCLTPIPLTCILLSSSRRGGIRLFRQVSTLARHFAQDYYALPAHFPIPTSPPSPRIGSIGHVARPQGAELARRLRSCRYATLEIAYILLAHPHARLCPPDPRLCHGRSPRDQLA